MIPANGESLKISIEQEWDRRCDYHVIGPISGLLVGTYLERETLMPKIKANNITVNYDQQVTGEPLIPTAAVESRRECVATPTIAN
jgi:hypothetical protein